MAIADVSIGVKKVTHWIGGKPGASNSGRSGKVWNPATGELQAQVDFASVEEVDHAVDVAKNAFAGWRATPLSRRAEIMFKLRELVDSQSAAHRRVHHPRTRQDAARCDGRSRARPGEHRVRLRHPQSC